MKKTGVVWGLVELSLCAGVGVFISGCAGLRSSPASSGPREHARRELTAEQKRAVYYSDLGPDRVDVSDYPSAQKDNYEVYRHACSQCHTLARSINAPVVDRRFWEFYIASMRFNTLFHQDAAVPQEAAQAIVDFLEYDSNVRKVRRRGEFDALQEELKRRFRPLLEKRMRELQDGNQPLLLRRRP